MPVFKYHDLYIGQLLAYHTPPEEPQIRFMGTIDVQLAVSRDGIDWKRAGETECPSSRTARREASTRARYTWREAPLS